jgi:hypothetical protein
VNLIDEAESLILHQFAQSPRLKALVRSLTKPFEEVLENIESLCDGRYIDEAWGARLDILGKIIGQPRMGMDDETYKAWISVGIRLNIGSGTSLDVLNILRILLGKIHFNMLEYWCGDLFFVIFAPPKVPLHALFEITRRATPIGIQCHFVKADMNQSFRFDTKPFSDTHFAEFFEENVHE